MPGEEYLIFMERSLVNTFVPARRIGVMAYNDFAENKNATWFVGSFREGFTNLSTLEYSNEGDYGVTCRLAVFPYYDESTDGRYLIHFGAAYEFTGANTSKILSSTDARHSKPFPKRTSIAVRHGGHSVQQLPTIRPGSGDDRWALACAVGIRQHVTRAR